MSFFLISSRRERRRLSLGSLLIFLSVISSACQQAGVRHEASAKNRGPASHAPYVILVSIDGYRWDFNRLFHPQHLTQIETDGVAAKSLLPIFPSKTFPNHYSIATGLYANHHGLVSNEFWDPARGDFFALYDRQKVQDGTWYGGEPIWSTASQQGLLTGCLFWIGAESEIGGVRPHYFLNYDPKMPDTARVDQVLAWLAKPEEERPHLITLYFNAVDTAAHRFGIQSPEVAQAIREVDNAIGRLRAGVEKLKLPADLIFVSDHGLIDVRPEKIVFVDSNSETAALLKKFKVMDRGPQMLLYLKPGEDRGVIEKTRASLERTLRHAKVLSPEELASLHYDGNPRTGDLVIAADPEYLLGTAESQPKTMGANHGWDVRSLREMEGVFFALGPDFKSHARVDSFENVNIYPLITHLLGLSPASSIDGRISEVEGVLKESSTHSKGTSR